MSTLKTNTIQHLTSGFNNVVAHTDGAGTANAVHARAWVNFNGTGTVAIRGSFNVTSITDVGVGQYRVNLSNAMADTNYSCIISSSYTTAATAGYLNMEDDRSGGVRSSSAYPIGCHNNSSLNDAEWVSTAVFR